MTADVIECVVVGTLMPVVLVMTPEMFVTKALVRAALVALLRNGRISIFLIDECDNPLVSTSEQFRGSCRGLGLNLGALEAMAAKDARETRRSPPRVGLSGTVPRQLTAEVAEDIGLRAPLLLVTSVDRANLRHVQVRLPRGAKFKARFKALCELVLGTDATVSVLIFAVSKKDVLKVAEQLAKVLRRVPHDGREDLAITGGDADSLAEKRSKSARFRTSKSILVTNTAGARGLDHGDLPVVVKFAEPSGLAERVQVDGCGARLAEQSAICTQLYNRRGLFNTAGILRSDSDKLAALSDVIAAEETIR
ncbi:P-loop containing nucleoside triphosphate hydrolase protein [Pelagophyceae sp. CCMP2097]|nr:P-loop containing nucleoside triphosphate hydrolase protein [Pelagophyceae sp. CCMP2097]